MQKTLLFKPIALISAVVLMFLSGCAQQDLVYQKPLAELNAKAQQMLQAGDVDGAVSRLEAAHDLSPEEPNTAFNLAVAYQMQGSHDKAIALFKELLDKPGHDKAELEKNLGITYEAKADALDSKARDKEGQPDPLLAQEAMDAYREALQHYEAALPGSKNAAELQKQISLLQAKLQQQNQAKG